MIFSTDFCKGALCGFAENVLVKLSGGKPPDPLCYHYGTIQDISNITNVKGEVIKHF